MADRAPMTKIVRQLRSGQVTIPVYFRRKLGITEDTLLQMTVIGGELRITPVCVREADTGTPWLKELYARFAPVREEAAPHSEVEINADIDRALEQVRRNMLKSFLTPSSSSVA